MLRATGAGATDILDRYDAIRRQIDEEVERLADAPRLGSAAEIMAPLAPRHPTEKRQESVSCARRALSEGSPYASYFAESINATLDELLTADRRVIVFGEDVGVKGGVYGVTARLARKHGAARASTPSDERQFSVWRWALGSRG